MRYVKNQFKFIIMKRITLILIAVMGMVLISFSQLYLGYHKNVIDKDIQYSIMFANFIDNNDGTYTQAVEFIDGHSGVYTYSENNICILYVLGFAKKKQFVSMTKDIKTHYKQIDGYEKTWIEYQLGYICAISIFPKKKHNIIAVYPISEFDDIKGVRKVIEESLTK